MLGLALAAVALYLLELRGLVNPEGPARGVQIAIDIIFVVDTVAKAVTRGRSYLTSAWIVIDVVSCLPAIALFANAPFFAAIRFTRIFRMLRVLRGIRLLGAMRLVPALKRFGVALQPNRETTRFRIALNVGAALYSVAFLAVLAWVDASRPSEQALELEFFMVLGAILTSALFVFVLHHELQDASLGQIHALLNIALPEQVARHFVTHPDAYHDRARGQATILFMDFVGFTKTTEKLGADVQKLSQHLESAMDCVVGRLISHDLIIDKFIGDAIMAFRGGPLVAGDAADHARRVVKGALDGRRALLALGDPYFSNMKIGGASAECMIGAFGTSRRLSYTVLGDGVNLAARLEPASGHCAAETLFCDATRKLCGDDPAIIWRAWGRIRVKGKAEPLAVHEAFDPAVLTDRAFIGLYEQGLGAWAGKRIADARALFAQSHAARPGGDPSSQLHLAWCDELLAHGVPTGFEPVLTVAK